MASLSSVISVKLCQSLRRRRNRLLGDRVFIFKLLYEFIMLNEGMVFSADLPSDFAGTVRGLFSVEEITVIQIDVLDLKPYPRLSYEQGSHNAFYFSEEILSTEDCDKDLVVCDRATLFNMLIGLNGYTICSGIISEELNGPNIVARPLKVDDYMQLGYILPKEIRPSALTSEYIRILKRLTA